MEQVYHFEDWTSAARMKNQIDPCIKIDVGVLREDDQILGYQMTVYKECIDKILYRFYIDVGLPSTWSLTTNEAIEFLNIIGFPCEFGREHYILPINTQKILRALLKLGYTHIYRLQRPATVMICAGATQHDDPTKKRLPITDVLGNEYKYNYHDYWFLNTFPIRIEELLN